MNVSANYQKSRTTSSRIDGLILVIESNIIIFFDISLYNIVALSFYCSSK